MLRDIDSQICSVKMLECHCIRVELITNFDVIGDILSNFRAYKKKKKKKYP